MRFSSRIVPAKKTKADIPSNRKTNIMTSVPFVFPSSVQGLPRRDSADCRKRQSLRQQVSGDDFCRIRPGDSEIQTESNPFAAVLCPHDSIDIFNNRQVGYERIGICAMTTFELYFGYFDVPGGGWPAQAFVGFTASLEKNERKGSVHPAENKGKEAVK